MCLVTARERESMNCIFSLRERERELTQTRRCERESVCIVRGVCAGDDQKYIFD